MFLVPFFSVLGFEFGASRLLGRPCTTWATPPAFFKLQLFFRYGRIFSLGLALDHNPLPTPSTYLCLPCIWSYNTPSLFVEMGSSLFVEMGSLFLPRVASDSNPPSLCLRSSWDYRDEPWCPAAEFYQEWVLDFVCAWCFFFFCEDGQFLACQSDEI